MSSNLNLIHKFNIHLHNIMRDQLAYYGIVIMQNFDLRKLTHNTIRTSPGLALLPLRVELSSTTYILDTLYCTLSL